MALIDWLTDRRRTEQVKAEEPPYWMVDAAVEAVLDDDDGYQVGAGHTCTSNGQQLTLSSFAGGVTIETTDVGSGCTDVQVLDRSEIIRLHGYLESWMRNNGVPTGSGPVASFDGVSRAWQHGWIERSHGGTPA